MKFYYNGRLVRTSKTHIYEWAVISETNGSVITCSAKREACESAIRSRISDIQRNIKWNEGQIRKIEEKHLKGIYELGKTCPIWTKEDYEKHIQSSKETIERIKKNWKIVRLEHD